MQKKGKLDFYFWVIDDVKNAYSLYTNQHILDHFLRDPRIIYFGKKCLVICSSCNPSHRVFNVNMASNDLELNFFFVYDVFFTIVDLRLPFTDFEVDYLNFINIVPS